MLLLLLLEMQEEEEFLFQAFVNRVAKASNCRDRGLVEMWVLDLGFMPELAGMTLEQVQQVDIREAVYEINVAWSEVSRAGPGIQAWQGEVFVVSLLRMRSIRPCLPSCLTAVPR